MSYNRPDVSSFDKKNKEKGVSKKCNFSFYVETIRKKINKWKKTYGASNVNVSMFSRHVSDFSSVIKEKLGNTKLQNWAPKYLTYS